MILGQGPENAKIILLTDYPTKESLANNKPVFGGENLYYSKLFRQAGYNLGEVFKTSFFRSELPPEIRKLISKGKLRYPIAKDNPLAVYNKVIEDAATMFLDEIKLLKEARWIISAGEIPLNALAKEKKIAKFQGSILPFADNWKIDFENARRQHIIPVLPYRTIVQNPIMEHVQPIFIGKAVRYLSEQYVPFNKKYNIWVCNDARAFREFINRNRNSKFWTSDYETLHNYPTCISFCGDGKESVTIPLLGAQLKQEIKQELWFAVVEFFKWLKSSRTPNGITINGKLINQNFNYDWKIGDKAGMAYGDCYGGDTMIYSHVIYPEFPRDLGFLTALYTDIPYFKDEGKEFDPRIHDFSRLYLYCAQDALATHIIHSEQEKDAEDLGVSEFYHQKEAPLLLLYHSIEENGIRVDEAARFKLVHKYDGMLEETQDYVAQFTEKPINFASPKQVAEFVYGYLGCAERYNVVFDPETGERSKTLATGADELEEIAIREDNPQVADILYKIIAIRKIEKVLSFLETPCYPDGKMRCGTKLTGTKGGRTSGAQPIDFDLIWNGKKLAYEKVPMGYSFQTIPKHPEKLPDGTIIGGDLRLIFVPDEGWIFVEGDKSQAEARVVCVLSNDLHLLPLFDDKKVGIHRTTASWIFNVAPELVYKKGDLMRNGLKADADSMEYNIGKRARHAGNYGMTPPRLAVMAHIKMNMAEFILNKFHKGQKGIIEVFHRDCIEVIRSRPSVMVTPHGRRREFFGRKDESAYKESFSYYPQCVVSDDLKFGAKRMYDQGKEWIMFLNEAHDSFLTMVKKEDKYKYVDLWKKEMEQPIDFTQGTFKRDIQLIIPTELQWSENSWKEMRDLK